MGTSLTPEFWRQAAVLLVIAMAVTFVLSAALDALVLRAQQRRAARLPSGTGTSATTGMTGMTGTTTRGPAVRRPVKN